MSNPKKRKWLNAFVPHRLELLLSPAWQAVPRPLQKLLERLEIEHLRHGGYENGGLFVSYEQLVLYGLSKRTIRPTLALGEALKLITVFRTEEVGGSNIRPPNSYGLTYVPMKGKGTPGDEWKQVTRDQADRAVDAYRQAIAAGAGGSSEYAQKSKRRAA
jgi:hypothetical protein